MPLLNNKSIKMKKIFLSILFLFAISTSQLFAQNFFAQIQEVTITEGMSSEYEEFESFWSVVNEKLIADGHLAGWSFWKVNPTSNDNNPWADYVLYNLFSSEEQMKSTLSKSPEWWVEYVEKAHKGKSKRSLIRKYVKETLDNKYKERLVTYNTSNVAAFADENLQPAKGMNAVYIGMEQLNEDYERFETEYFQKAHQGNKMYWEFNKITDRSDNAYKPVTHNIFEVNKENSGQDQESSFVDEMMAKYGMASRTLHGWMVVELLEFKL